MSVKVVGAATERHGQMMRHLGEFLGLARIKYEDLGNGEDYTLVRADGEKLTLKVRGNKDQGGFLSVPVPGMEPLRGMGGTQT